MAVVEILLRIATALALVDPAAVGTPGHLLPVAALVALGCATVAAVLVLSAVVAALLLPSARAVPAGHREWSRLRTRIASSHPDADGHARPRAPGGVVTV